MIMILQCRCHSACHHACQHDTGSRASKAVSSLPGCCDVATLLRRCRQLTNNIAQGRNSSTLQRRRLALRVRTHQGDEGRLLTLELVGLVVVVGPRLDALLTQVELWHRREGQRGGGQHRQLVRAGRAESEVLAGGTRHSSDVAPQPASQELNTHTHTRARARGANHTHTQTQTQTRTHTHTNRTRTHARTHTHTHTNTHKHTHHTHTRTRTRTHTHTT